MFSAGAALLGCSSCTLISVSGCKAVKWRSWIATCSIVIYLGFFSLHFIFYLFSELLSSSLGIVFTSKKMEGERYSCSLDDWKCRGGKTLTLMGSCFNCFSYSLCCRDTALGVIPQKSAEFLSISLFCCLVSLAVEGSHLLWLCFWLWPCTCILLVLVFSCRGDCRAIGLLDCILHTYIYTFVYMHLGSDQAKQKMQWSEYSLNMQLICTSSLGPFLRKRRLFCNQG